MRAVAKITDGLGQESKILGENLGSSCVFQDMLYQIKFITQCRELISVISVRYIIVSAKNAMIILFFFSFCSFMSKLRKKLLCK